MLCTRTDVENRLGGQDLTSDDTIITALIAAAQGHIEREAQRTLEAAERQETFDPPDGPNVWLTHTPIIDTSTSTPFTVTVDGTELASSGYSVDPESGRLTRVVNGRPRSWITFKVQSIVVDYEGGYSDVPEDLVDICARAAARAYQAGESASSVGTAGVKQINLAGSDSVTFTDETSDVSTAVFLTPDEKEVARYYRNQVLA